MQKKIVEAYLYSAIGVAAMLLFLVAFNGIAAALKARVDLTEEKRHTLSAGTRQILGQLDSTVKARFYHTQVRDATPDSIYLSNYAKQVEDLLDDIRQASGGKLVVQKYNPQPDSDAEDSAKLDGIDGQPMPPYGENFYLGVSFSLLDQKVAIPFLAPSRERLLEYDLMRALSRVLNPDLPVIGVMSGLPLFGMPANPMMMQMGRQGQDPWIFIGELKQDFEVREVATSVEAIDDDIKVLMVVHPRELPEAAQYAIDQFVLRGGKLLAFLDPLSIADNQNSAMNPLQRATASGSNLERLLKAWGIDYDVNKVVADMNFKTAIPGRGGQPQEAPAVLSLTREALNQDDILTGQIDNLLLPYPGAFTGTPASGLTQTVLLQTSANSQLTDKIMAQFGGVDKDFKASDTRYALAVRLTGTFKTAFPDGKPAADPSPNAAAEDSETDAAPTADSLKESTVETSVILVADSDILFDPVVARVQTIPGFGMRIVNPLNGNLNFVQSAVEVMTGDNALIEVRSRASLNRPFTVVKKMEEEAQQAYRGKIRELEDSLQETQKRLNELQQSKQSDQRLVLSTEQQEELQRFRQKEADAKRELKNVRKTLRREIDSLENRLKWVNIAAMPLAIALTGIAAALYKRKKTAAR